MTDKELYKSLSYERKNAYLEMSADEHDAMKALCDDYMKFLDAGKTERECTSEAERLRLLRDLRIWTISRS